MKQIYDFIANRSKPICLGYNKSKKIILCRQSILLLTLITFSTKLLYSQNLIPNYSFEGANAGPNCQYGMGEAFANTFDSHMYLWKVARYTPNKTNAPDWIDRYNGNCMNAFFRYFCNNYLYLNYSSGRFITLQSQQYTNFWGTKKFAHEAIRVQLSTPQLLPGATYLLRMKVIPLRANTLVDGPSHMRVFFSKWGQHWNSKSNNNQLWEAINANVVLQVSDFMQCQFKIVERRIIVPQNMTDLKNIVLYAENNRMAVDDVELFEECRANITIENQFYDFVTFKPNGVEGNSFAEHAINTISAGNFGNGDVIVQGLGTSNPSFNARVTYTAGQRIVLSPGFKAQNNSYFHAAIVSCPNNIQ